MLNAPLRLWHCTQASSNGIYIPGLRFAPSTATPGLRKSASFLQPFEKHMEKLYQKEHKMTLAPAMFTSFYSHKYRTIIKKDMRTRSVAHNSTGFSTTILWMSLVGKAFVFESSQASKAVITRSGRRKSGGSPEGPVSDESKDQDSEWM